MLKTFILSAVVLLSTIIAHGQYTISGHVTDKANKPLEFLTVSLLKDSAVIATALTDSLGNYKITNLKKGNYFIRFSYINFSEKDMPVSLSNDTNINKQVTDNNINSLAEVTVVSARKPLIERKIDRLVFNVQNSLSTIGGDALDALGKTPGVSVQNNLISLIGKGGVSVMVDDRLIQLSGDDLANYLKSISADDIASIEVITNPPAKYDAQGNNGLINIILKRTAKKGYTGTVRFGYRQSIYPEVFGGGNINYNKGKFKLYGNLNLEDGQRMILLQRSIYYATQTWDAKDNLHNFSKSLEGLAGVDFQASKNTLIGLSYNGSTDNNHFAEYASTPIYNVMKTIDSTLATNATIQMNSHSNAANLYLKQSLGANGKQLTVNGDLFNFESDMQRVFANTSYDANGSLEPNSLTQDISSSRQTSNVYTLKADVDLPYKKYTIGFGGKISFIKNKSDVGYYEMLNNKYQVDSSQSNQFNYTENTQALYFNINKSIKKWAFQTGLRGEYTQTTGYSVSLANLVQTNPANNYFKVFPTVYISYNMNDKNVFSINYGKRINRPGYWNLNPFRLYSNPYTYMAGNPFLQPAYNNNIEMSYTYNNVFTTSLTFNDENNRFRDVTFVQNGSDTAVTKPLNFITGYTYLSNTSYTYKKINWLQSIASLCMYYNISNSTLPQTLPSVTGFGTWFETDNQATLNKQKTMMGGFDFFYVFPAVEDINKNSAFYSLSVSFKVLLLNKNLQLAFNANDLLKTATPRVYTEINGIQQIQSNYYDSRQFRVTGSYKFGNSKINRQEHQAGNQEERNRAN